MRGGNRIEGRNLIPLARVQNSKTLTTSTGSRLRNNSPEMPRMRPRFSGTMPHGMNWPAVYVLAKAGTSLLAKELTMRNKVLAIAAILGAIAAPIAAQAQTTITTGTAGGSTVVIGEHEGIVAEQRPAFREYIVRERVPNYTITERVIVGGVLPETGVTYY